MSERSTHFESRHNPNHLQSIYSRISTFLKTIDNAITDFTNTYPFIYIFHFNRLFNRKFYIRMRQQNILIIESFELFMCPSSEKSFKKIIRLSNATFIFSGETLAIFLLRALDE